MTEHVLQGRTEDEVLWFHRRGVLRAAAAWVAAGGFAAAQAQQRSNIVELQGEALLNGQRLRPGDFIQTGDQVQTGPGSNLVFVVGNSAFRMRPETQAELERGQTLHTVSLLRLLTGAIGAAWGRGSPRRVVTPTLTAGIRGTGTYTEVRPKEGNRTYFCNCYGSIEMAAGGDHVLSVSEYHQSFWGEVQPVGGRMLTPARAINHTDEEMEFLARLVGERTPWQVAGRRGNHDGSGYMDPLPGQTRPGHPLAR